MRYYHGGPKGLREILPPCETRADTMASIPTANNKTRRDRVYVTTDIVAAIMFACGHGRKNCAVYEVEPVAPIPDPDCTAPGLAFEAERAKVIRRVRVNGKDFRRARRYLRLSP